MTKKYLYLFFLFFIISSVNADDHPFRWSVKGFGTLGVTGSDADQIGFYRSITQTQDVKNSWGISTDSRLGLQIDLDINSSLHATTQWIARDHGGNFLEQNLEWAFLRWSPIKTLDIRAGRMAADLFLLSDYRNVGYAYPWIRPPHEFYAEIPFYHYDGIDITKKFIFEDNLLSFRVAAGYSFNQIPTNVGRYDVHSSILGANLIYESGNWRLRGGYAYLRLLSNPPTQKLEEFVNSPLINALIPNVGQFKSSFQVKNTDIQYFSLGAAYDDGIWIAHAEASYTDTQMPFFPDAGSAYFSIGRRFNKLTVYSLFGISHSVNNPITLPEPLSSIPVQQRQQLLNLSNSFEEAINNNGIDEKSVSLGIRWDFYPKVAFKAQWSHYWLGKNGTLLWERRNFTATPDHANVLSFGFDFIF